MNSGNADSFDTVRTLDYGGEEYRYNSLVRLDDQLSGDLSTLPYSVRILLENLLRHEDGETVTAADIEAVLKYNQDSSAGREIAYYPERVIMQDFTGVPAVVDFAALREALADFDENPTRINPRVPAELVIDHSVQVDEYASRDARQINERIEFERNYERYSFLRWGQESFSDLQIVPPGAGIIHQVNLEYFSPVIRTDRSGRENWLYPDTLVGTDSHTTMINSLGVMGWGVGGIEAEAVMLGEPYYILLPEVVGVKLTGELPAGVTATDLVLNITSRLREEQVVGKYVEYFGPGARKLTLTDRAIISNMTPEYGATMGFFPVDEETLSYLRQTGRSPKKVKLVEKYCKQQQLFYHAQQSAPVYSDTLEIDLDQIDPTVAGPTLPHQQISLHNLKNSFKQSVQDDFTGIEVSSSPPEKLEPEPDKKLDLRQDYYPADRVSVTVDGQDCSITHGSIVIAALASCTNTSSPALMIGAGILARNAVERGLKVPPYVKTSFAPGSRAVTGYLETLGLLEPLEELNFHLVGYGCTSCIGNSGPLAPEVEEAIVKEKLAVSSVICGNRNFEGRISPLTRGNYLVSPPLVVALAIAGTVDIDLSVEPLGTDSEGNPVYLEDLWPDQSEIKMAIDRALDPKLFQERYSDMFEGNELWQNMQIPSGKVYDWDPGSTYIKCPPFFKNMSRDVRPPADIEAARCLALLGDSVTTDHISPAGDIPEDSPAADYLRSNGVSPEEFNTYGSRRGNHEVMMRGTFANVRLDNQLVSRRGGYTRYFPGDKITSIYEAAMNYQEKNIPLIIMAGKQYGTGSSRDWAAKGTQLLGVDVVIAESYERIHRANLIGMGVLPAQFEKKENWKSLGLDGTETYSISGIEGVESGDKLKITATAADNSTTEFSVRARLDSDVEVKYYRHGGILQYVLRQML